MQETNLIDKKGRTICVGDIVQWDDSEGVRTAEVVGSKHHIGFRCFKNSIPDNWAVGHIFCLDHFMYADTQHYLTIVKKATEITSASQTSKEGMELEHNSIHSELKP